MSDDMTDDIMAHAYERGYEQGKKDGADIALDNTREYLTRFYEKRIQELEDKIEKLEAATATILEKR